MKKVVLLVLAVILVVAGFCLYRFNDGLLGMYLAHKWSEGYPIVCEPLAELKETAVAPTGQRLSYLGLEFAVPWSDLDSRQERSAPEDVTLTFRSGIKIRIARTPLNEFVGGTFTTGHEQAGLGTACIPGGSFFFSTVCRSWKTAPRSSEAIFGREVTQSDYAFFRKVLETTPEKIDRLGISAEDLQRDSILLAHKGAIMAGHSRHALLNVAGQNFKGFQQDSPKAAPTEVSLILFDDQGAVSIELKQDASTGTSLSQADINLIVQSLRRAATEVQAAESKAGAPQV